MATDLDHLHAFVAVARARGFREAARTAGTSASRLSDTVRRLEAQLGVRLFNRTTRSVALTQAGQELLARLAPALTEVEAALDAVNGFRDKPAGTLRLNVPLSAAKLVLPSIVPDFLAAYPDIRLEVVAEESFVDVLAAGCDAGIRYDDRLEQDMIAVPIGPRVQRFAAGASPDYLNRRGRPRASRRPDAARLPARPLSQRGDACVGFRAGRRDRAYRCVRTVGRADWRRGRSRCRRRYRGGGRHVSVRRLAAPAL
ncbi:HTH-type transcriptional regulator HdfR [Achromobacter animicus]|nr:HTH-type transcriptional regulator HdfR [Achromobacter animicus]